jgi:hypothetical protein
MVYIESDYKFHALIPPKDVTPQKYENEFGVFNPATYARRDVRTEGYMNKIKQSQNKQNNNNKNIHDHTVQNEQREYNAYIGGG